MTNKFKILTREAVDMLGDRELLDYCNIITSRLREADLSHLGLLDCISYYNTEHKEVLQTVVTTQATRVPTLNRTYEVVSVDLTNPYKVIFRGYTACHKDKKYIVEFLDNGEVTTLPIQLTCFREVPERPEGYYVVRFDEGEEEVIAYHKGGEWSIVGHPYIWETQQLDYISDTPINLKENMTCNNK